jgi:hypothetical protein
VAGYLLISSSWVAILAIQQIDKTAFIWKAVIISTTVSIVTFLVIVICTLLSASSNVRESSGDAARACLKS